MSLQIEIIDDAGNRRIYPSADYHSAYVRFCGYVNAAGPWGSRSVRILDGGKVVREWLKVTLRKRGDFYEARGDIAESVARILGLTIARDADAALIGFPYFRLETYRAALEAAGHRVVVLP